MKKFCLFLSIGFSLLSSVAIAQSEINLAHKSIGKEIRRTFGIDTYQLNSLNAIDSTTLLSPVMEQYFLVQSNLNKVGYLYVGRVNCCRAEGCSIPAIETKVTGFEYFDYLIIYDSLHTIRTVRVFNYQATHGHEICSSSWLRQFKGYTYGAELELGNSVDAISGATVSVENIIFDIERASASLVKLLEWTASSE